MTAVQTIEKALAANLLTSDLIKVPGIGASSVLIQKEERLLGRPLLPEHRRLLQRWNGIDLEVVRFYGCGEGTDEVLRLSAARSEMVVGIEGCLEIGSDAAGFVYIQGSNGSVYELDSDSGDYEFVAVGIDDFVGRLVFGSDAAQFAGDEWYLELKKAGMVG
ncbi:MAG: SMI1/KNR4 family protein [Verrucomicrobiota bacterium]